MLVQRGKGNKQRVLPGTGGAPSDGSSSSLLWIVVIVAAFVLVLSGGAIRLARLRQRSR